MSRNIRQEICDYVREYQEQEGFSPSLREIGRALGITNVAYHVNALKKRGLIDLQPRKGRSIQLAGIPVKGTIAAGDPLETFVESEQEMLDVEREIVCDGMCVYKVRDKSMVDDHICEGDYVVIQEQQTCEDDDIILAVCLKQGSMGGAVLKRYQCHEGSESVYLVPVNIEPELKPEPIPKGVWDRDWRVQGRVIAILRPHVVREK
ncbi:MAG TPA: S24 family peptidase [Methylomirabilota bacterium]|nr:S24 family peptidase [Methylomirabilota bacterium]